MSNDEARQHKALALLEFEEAKAAHKAVLDRIVQSRSNLDIVGQFLACVAHDQRCIALREQVLAIRFFDAVNDALELERDLKVTKKKLDEAVAVKRTFGLE